MYFIADRSKGITYETTAPFTVPIQSNALQLWLYIKFAENRDTFL
jgi:hypothetical protein